jgi:hypothetical protein
LPCNLTLNLQIPLLGEFYAAIRQHAVCSLHSLLLSSLANVADYGHAQRTLDVMLPALLARLTKEQDLEVLYTVAESLSMIVKTSRESISDGAAVPPPSSSSPPSGSPGGVPPAVAAKESDATPHTVCSISAERAFAVFQAIQAAMSESIERRTQFAKQIAANPDADRDDADGLDDDLAPEDEFMVNLVDSVGYVVKQLGAAAVPVIASSIGEPKGLRALVVLLSLH